VGYVVNSLKLSQRQTWSHVWSHVLAI